MDVKWLDDFLALAECRSYTGAARLRNTSQSGLSRRIQSLEQWMGGRLIDRDSQPLQLTEAGMRFLPMATNLRSAVVAARHLCTSQPPRREAPVTLAVAEGMETGMLPTLLGRLKAQGFDTPVNVVLKSMQASPAALLDGEVDLWLAPQHAQLPLLLDAATFEAATVAHDRISPIVGLNGMGGPLHVLPGSRDAPTPLLEYGTVDYLSQVVGVLMAAAPVSAHWRRAFASDSLHSLCALVRQGMGVAFLPESMVRAEFRRGEVARADSRWSGSLEIRLIRAGRAFPRSPADAAQRFWQGLTSTAERAVHVPHVAHKRPATWPVHEVREVA